MSSIFSALNYRDFRLFWGGQAISTIGSQMHLVAINWHVYLITKSAFALGMIGLVRVLPIIVCSLMGGLFADTYNRKRVILITHLVMFSSAGFLSLLSFNGLDEVWPIYILTALSSAAVAFDNPARQAMLPMLVAPKDFQNAVSLALTLFQISMIVGPVIAGLLLGSYGPAIVYVINALSYLAVIAGVLMLDTSGDVEGAADKGISMHAFKEGLSFVWSTPVIVQSMVLDFAATFFGSATALLPIFAAEVLMVGPRGLGWLSAAPAVGAVLAGLSMARFGPFRRQGVIVIFAVAVYGLATVGFGLSKVFWVSLLMLALTGAADTVSTVIRQTIRQLLTPDRLRGRMTSINMIFFMGGPQLGELEAGVLAEFIGAARAVVFGGLGCLVTVILAAMKSKHLIAYQWKGREENE